MSFDPALIDAATHAVVGPMPALLPDWMDPTTLITGFLEDFGTAAVAGIAAIIFIETGLFFPILPGDSLLFVAGAFVAQGSLGISLPLLIAIMITAAFLGDQNAYWIGRLVGPRLFKEDSKIFKRQYIDKTHEYFEKYGGRTIVIARFVPVVRTFSAVSAGVSRMSYRTFISYDLLGAVLWGGGVTLLGYLLGNITFVKENIEVLLVLIVLVSVLPMAYEILKARRESKAKAAAGPDAAMATEDNGLETASFAMPTDGTDAAPFGTPATIGATEQAGMGENGPVAFGRLPTTPYLGKPDTPASAGGGTGQRDVLDTGLPPRHARKE